MEPAFIAAVVPAAITATGTVLAAVIRARRPVLDEFRQVRRTVRCRVAGTVISMSTRQRSDPTGCWAGSFVPMTVNKRGGSAAHSPLTRRTWPRQSYRKENGVVLKGSTSG